MITTTASRSGCSLCRKQITEDLVTARAGGIVEGWEPLLQWIVDPCVCVLATGWSSKRERRSFHLSSHSSSMQRTSKNSPNTDEADKYSTLVNRRHAHLLLRIAECGPSDRINYEVNYHDAIDATRVDTLHGYALLAWDRASQTDMLFDGFSK